MDDAVSLHFHLRQHDANRVEIAEVVDFELPANLVERLLFERSENGHSGVVYEDINPSPFIEDSGDRFLNLRLLANVTEAGPELLGMTCQK